MDKWYKKIDQAWVIHSNLDFRAKIINIGHFQGTFFSQFTCLVKVWKKKKKVIFMDFNIWDTLGHCTHWVIFQLIWAKLSWWFPGWLHCARVVRVVVWPASREGPCQWGEDLHTTHTGHHKLHRNYCVITIILTFLKIILCLNAMVRSRFELWWNFGRPTWSLAGEKICFICMKSQNFKKYLILKFKTIFKTCFIFMIALTVYE